MSDNSRRWRAVLRTAVTWGAAWAAIGGGLVALVGLFSADPRIDSLPERIGLALGAGAMWGVRFGVIGAVIGTAFSTAVRFGFRGRRVGDISPVRFAALGAAVGGAGVPLFLQTMHVLSGDGPLAWNLVSNDAVFGAVIGAAVAGGTILLARRGDPGAAAQPDRLAATDDPAALPAPGAPEPALEQRARTSVRS